MSPNKTCYVPLLDIGDVTGKNEVIMNDELYDIELLNKVIEYNKNKFDSFIYGSYFETIPEYEKILNARYHKTSRVKQRLVYLLSRYEYIWFCTFTFDDKYINKTERTKRDLIKSCLNNYDFKYILNIDYGKQTMREHFHCIVATNYNINLDDYFKENYKCFSLSIQCKNGYNDLTRLSKYINKLVNHCIKATTNKQRIVYNFKGYDDLFPYSTDKRLAYLMDYYSLMNSNSTIIE